MKARWRVVTRPMIARRLAPNWFTSVMGTGIVANAAVELPRPRVAAALHGFAVGVWTVAAAVLLVLVAATVAQGLRHRDRVRAHLRDPAVAPFFGAPPMALLTVGAGTLLAGVDVIGSHPAVIVASVLWTLGTLIGLAAAAGVSVLLFTRLEVAPETTFATLLMPIVPPMVSAATGAALISHLPAGQDRLDLLLACYALFGVSLIAAMLILPMVWARLVHYKLGPARMVPTLWITLGPFGQSVTAINLLGAAAAGVISTPYAGGLRVAGVVFGVPMFGFAMLWLGVAIVLTLRTAHAGLPFSLAWWSFTFPLGTVVTGTSALADRTGSTALAWWSVALYGLLLGAWLVTLAQTVRDIGRERVVNRAAPTAP
jgi:C4-dicarboxylate transporter/malic acid transport protein